MAENTVEARLVGQYVDKLSAPLAQTKSIMQGTMSAMSSGAAGFAGALANAIDQGLERMSDWGKQLKNQADNTEGLFKRMGLAALGLGLIVAREFYQIGKAVIGTIVDLAKTSSEVLELRLAFDSLTQTMGVSSEKFLGDLKRSTEGLVSNSVLLRNANRVLAADIPVTAEQYTKLAGNIFKLSKAAGQDGARAIDVLTDALIKGNGRALAAVGVNLRVKDAVSEVAAAAGQTAGKLETEAKMRTFVNELTEASSAAVKRNAADYTSLADVMQKAGRIYREEYVERLGEGIGRSMALAKALGFLADQFDELGVKDSEVYKIARATNSVVISILKGISTLIDAITAVGPFLAAFWAGLKAIGSAVFVVLNGVLGYLVHFVGRVIELFGMIPGAMGEPFRRLVPVMAGVRDQLWQWAESAHRSFESSFDGFGSNILALEDFNVKLKDLRKGMEIYRNSVVEAGKGDKQMDRHTRELAESQKKLNEQLERTDQYYKSLKFRAAMAKEDEKFLQKMDAASMQEILNQIGRANGQAPLPQSPDIGRQAPGTDIAGQTREDMLKRQQEWERIQEAMRQSMERNTPEWLKPYKEIYAQLSQLNQLDLNVFQTTMLHFRDNMVSIGTQVTEAWGSFWADMVSGQENSGKKFLAALMNIVSNEILALSIKHAALAVSSLAMLDFAGAARHAAAAAALGAIGGTIKGLAANLAQTNRSAGTSGSFQAATPRPYSGQQVQVLQVGAAGRAQNAQEAQVRQPAQQVEVTIRPPKGWVAEEVRKDVRSNGPIRTLIQANAY